MGKETIIIKNLSVRYSGQPKESLKNINLSITQGEIVAIIGKSGAGKTTLVRCINGEIPNLYEGEFYGVVEIYGELVKSKELYEIARYVSMISADDISSQLFSSNVYLEIAFGLENQQISPDEIRKKVNDILSMLDLSGLEYRHPETMSTGERQKLAIASVLSLSPNILILDEMTSELDHLSRSAVFSICEMLRTEGISVIFICNEIIDILYADRVILLDEGEIVVDSTPKEILRRPLLLEKCGIRAWQISKLFQDIGYTQRLPVDIDEALKIVDDEHWIVSGLRYDRLVQQDKPKDEEYNTPLSCWLVDVGYVYPEGIHALDNITLRIKEGEFVGIIGKNGSGKTTLAKLLAGTLLPVCGDVFVLGKNTKNISTSELLKYTGYVPQEPEEYMVTGSVFEEVAFGLQNLGLSRNEIYSKVYEVLKLVKLDEYENLQPDILTKGEQKRLAIACILAIQPRIIIIDEPVSGLDYNEIKDIMNTLIKLNQKGHTIIIVTHCMWLITEYTHRVIVMKDGNILHDNSPREIFSNRSYLKDTHLKPPEIVDFGYGLGRVFLSVEEILSCISKGY
jgi:energy-coupling factor transport system ATP-binding protein